jgi:hypothetical protein
VPGKIPFQRSYRWGKFHGWTFIIVGIPFALSGPFHSDPGKRFASYLCGVILPLMGAALISKRRAGLILFFLWTVIGFGGFVALGAPHPEAWLLLVAWWIIPAIFYYPKRWREFSSRLEASVATAESGEHHDTSVGREGVVLQRRLGFMHDYGQGLRQDYAQAAVHYRQAAEQGDSDSQVNLAILFENGQGIPQNLEQAVAWYRRSADSGNPCAQCNLGRLYSLGHGVRQDFAIAAEFYRGAAERGIAEAQNNLGALYEDGVGVPKDQGRAAHWYGKAAEQGYEQALRNLAALNRRRGDVLHDKEPSAAKTSAIKNSSIAALATSRSAESVPRFENSEQQVAIEVSLSSAAEQGDATAQYKLGSIYETRKGIPRNCEIAAAWYRKASEQGNSYAQHRLARLYERGLGVMQSDSEAYFWFYISASGDLQSDQQAYLLDRDTVAIKLTPIERDEVVREAKRWMVSRVGKS